LSDAFCSQNSLKQGSALSPAVTLGYAISRAQVGKEKLNLNSSLLFENIKIKIYRTIIFQFSLLREEHRLRSFGNKGAEEGVGPEG
jgi:hypothetical protein